jgi:hypothetical protein
MSTTSVAVNKFVEKHLNEMLLRYKDEPVDQAKGENIEFEIRFKDISRDVFESVCTAAAGDKSFGAPTLECSVNFISTTQGILREGDGEMASYIRKIAFNGTKPGSDTYYKKERLMRQTSVVDDYITYSVGLSKETPISKFPAASNAIVRFKVRVSFEYIAASVPEWRFDLTAIRQGSLSDLGAHLKTIRSKLFTDTMTAKNVIRELDYDSVDSFEIEIEHIGPSRALVIADLSITKKLFSLINPHYLHEAAYQEEIYKVAKYIVTNRDILHQFKHPSHRLKQLSNQVIALNKTTYYIDIYPPDGYFLTIKADGQRVIVSVDGNRCRILRSDTMMEFIQSATKTFVPGPVTIVDAEIIFDRGEDKTQLQKDDAFTLYLFDVMVIRGENISSQSIGDRIEYLSEAVSIIEMLVPGNVEMKKYIRLTEGKFEAGFREIWEADYKFPRDGLIITMPGEPYADTKNYKWKPLEKNTIDFLAVSAPPHIIGIKPYEKVKDMTLYLLFVGINHQMRESLGIEFLQFHKELSLQGTGYYPIHFCPSANPLAYIYYHPSAEPSIDRKIVELALDNTSGKWLFHGVREDRKLEKHYFGNDFRVAELTYINYIDPFLFEDLWRAPSCYFTKTATDIYTASNKYKRFVISLLLANNLSGAAWVIDLGAGRGADLPRYQGIKVKNALFIDIDPTAIAELIRRKFSLFSVKKKHMDGWLGEGEQRARRPYDGMGDADYKKLVAKDMKQMTIHTLVADLKSPYADLIMSTLQFNINAGMIDGIVCNFALHYMCDTIENLRNILIFSARMLKVKGLFMFTVMDGAAVFKLLKPLERGQRWELREGGVVKYAIKKNYVGDTLAGVGQIVSVAMPFCDEMYDEPLCNVDVVISEAKKLGFAVELNAPMTEYMSKFAAADKGLFDRLSTDDKTYIGLYRFVTLRLVKSVKKV